jgi:hypothetical protein
MNASTAGDSAASSRTVGGRRVTTGGRRGRGPPPARLPSWRRDPRLERTHGSWAAMAAAAASPAVPHAAAAAAAPPAVPPAAVVTIATPQIDLSDSDSNSRNSSSDSSADDDSGSCVIVEPVGNKGKTSFVCLSGDVRRIMLDKVKANASKGNPNASSHEITMTMLYSVVARRTQLIELAVELDATMKIPNGGGGTSICDLLLRAIPMSIPTRLTKISVTVHMVHIWVIMSTMLKTGVLRRTEKHDLQSYLEFMIWIETSSRRELAEADPIDKNASHTISPLKRWRGFIFAMADSNVLHHSNRV